MFIAAVRHSDFLFDRFKEHLVISLFREKLAGEKSLFFTLCTNIASRVKKFTCLVSY